VLCVIIRDLCRNARPFFRRTEKVSIHYFKSAVENMKLLLISFALGAVVAQQICGGAGVQYEPTIVANGFSTYVLANKLSSPRGIVFDKEGNLLVLEQFKGVTALTLKEENGCITVASKTAASNDPSVSIRTSNACLH
jgi:hypothetical protein